ncbi:MAG: hypothetical protein ACK5M7_06605 [Draconibacterium sp.]
MTKAIFYKEWIKLRWVLFVLAGVFVAMVPYLVLSIHSKFRFAGKAHLWSVIAEKDVNLISQLQYLPLLAGLLLGLFQFVPEMNKKSLKLTLHLPLPEKLTVIKMMLFGFGGLTAIFVTTGGVLLALLGFSLPPTIIGAWLIASLPWYLAGLAAYLLAAWVCIEPSWKQRAVNALISGSLLTVFLRTAGSYGYQHFTPALMAVCLLAMLFPFYSVFRFKEGVPE